MNVTDFDLSPIIFTGVAVSVGDTVCIEKESRNNFSYLQCVKSNFKRSLGSIITLDFVFKISPDDRSSCLEKWETY